MRHSKGSRSRTRNKLKHGRFSIAEALQSFKIGQSVVLTLNPAVHTGMPSPRYQGSAGKIIEKRGRAFIVELLTRGKTKQVIAKPEHLSAMKGEKLE